MKRKLSLLLALLIILTGCGTIPNQITKQEKKRVCVIVKAMDSIHWMQVADGLQQAAKKYNLALTILYPEAEDDEQTQLSLLKDAIASHPDALAIAPCNAESVQNYVVKAREQGIKTVYLDENVNAPTHIPYVGSDNELIGEMAAQAFASQLRDGANVAVIAGSEEQTTHCQRVDGFVQYIEQSTTLQMTEVCHVDNSSRAGGRAMMAQLLEKYDDLDAVFCTNAMMVIGALQERENQGRNGIALVGVDTQSDALSAVQNGQILAMISQNGYEIGYRTIKVIADELAGNAIEENYYVENRAINQANVKGFLSEYYMEGRES